jgi:hypothetical protein
MKSDELKRDLPRRNEVALKQSNVAGEKDARLFFIAAAVTVVAGLFKIFLLERFAKQV